MKKYKVGILGATGMVGQNYIRLLEKHPWFSLVYLAASEKSSGMKYKDAVVNRWVMNTSIPKGIEDIVVEDVASIDKAVKKCDFVFSCFEISDKEKVKKIEEDYANAGLPVISNASANRWSVDVPVLIPEINGSHTDMIKTQQNNHSWNKGFIVAKPNCSLQSYIAPIYALIEKGYKIDKIIVTTMQAVSGAGYPGVSSLDMIDNIVPYIGGEEEKTEKEPLKILGDIKNGKFVNNKDIVISATCTRVPVSDGHTASVSFSFKGKKPRESEIIEIWNNFKSEPQEFNLPSAPLSPIIYTHEPNRPQPKKDRDRDKCMSCIVGRLRPCSILDYKFVALSHNTVRGASGGGILNAEYLVKKGLI